IHSLQLSLYREDEDLDVGQGVPTVTTAEAGNTAAGRRRQIGIDA
ncbi:MAG: hypothetical protein JWQ72_196, partial [Polaromonas sp.]|nr:hypothetical protein [Polaromonas sp.]